MRTNSLLIALWIALAVLGCNEESPTRGTDAGGADAGGADAGDAGHEEPGSTDAGGTDAGETDGGLDAGGAVGEVRFAVIGDYGSDLHWTLGTGGEKVVAELVKSWSPDFVVTTGDNNYPDGAAATIDENIGKYYAEFIGDYAGTYGPGSATNRFWPSLGNHDWHAPDVQPYLDYFTLPGNERYYDVDLGLVHLFIVDSDPDEPDGTDATGTQGKWLEAALAASTACLDVVVFHHPPYNSGSHHGSSTYMRWPFEAWGADVVMSGHEHLYERLQVGGIPYFVNGFGGTPLYDFGDALPESKARFADDHGAIRITVTQSEARYEAFRATGGKQIDSHVVTKACP